MNTAFSTLETKLLARVILEKENRSIPEKLRFDSLEKSVLLAIQYGGKQYHVPRNTAPGSGAPFYKG